MKIVGLITEYNPFHKGHEYHIQEALRISGADKAIVVMSGDFVQRGTPAIMPKHLRTKVSLDSGVSLVLELPVRFATGSAEFFASGAIDLLNQLGCVDSVCFGSECGDMDQLNTIASLLVDEPSEYRILLNSHLKSGLSFPKARQLAIMEYGQNHNLDGSILSNPNNILGVEYLKALYKSKSSIKPYTIKRETTNYHDQELGELHSSATSIRKAINKNEQLFLEQLPPQCLNVMSDNYKKRYPINNEDFNLLFHHKLLMSTSESLIIYMDVTQEIANRIMKYRNQFKDIEQFIELIKTKNITRSRVSRCLLHILLEIPHYELSTLEICNYYARVLGFRKSDSEVLTKISESSTIPLITKLGQYEDVLNSDACTLLKEDINSSNLYELIASHKFKQPYIPEPQKTMIIL